jgi:quercetin dioxygenase-like cupin family protein
MSNLVYIENAATEIEIPQSGMSKRVLLQEPCVRAMGFGFAAGHELKEHTAPVDVVLHFLDGEAEVTLAGEGKHARAGTLVHIPQALPHSVRAITPVKMILLMLIHRE